MGRIPGKGLGPQGLGKGYWVEGSPAGNRGGLGGPEPPSSRLHRRPKGKHDLVGAKQVRGLEDVQSQTTGFW